MSAPEEIRLQTARGTLAALKQECSGGPRVLCLHGWLDNAASFIPLLKLWTDLNVVALDFPGHGRSSHRHPEASYYFNEYLLDVDATLDALGWQDCHLLGHSMGGAVGTLYAAAAPERVRSLVLLDVLGPITARPETTAARLGKSLKASRSPPRRQKRYASIEEMIATRQANADLSEAAARLLCERSVRQTDDHHVWSNDPALHWVSPVLMTEEQALDCLRHIKAPVLVYAAQPLAPYFSEDIVRSRVDAVANISLHRIEGKHHFHMHQPQAIASAIQSFILEHNASEPKR